MPSALTSVLRLVLLATAACAAGVLYEHWQLYLPPECRGDIPRLVPFREDMTVCPGQIAITITIQLSDDGKDI